MVEQVKFEEPTEKQKDKKTYGFILGMHINGMINGGCFCAFIYSIYLKQYWFAVFFFLFFLMTIPPTLKQIYKRNQMLNNYRK